jgi:hypothetical protein
VNRSHGIPRQRSTAIRPTRVPDATRLLEYREAAAELEAEVRKLGLWHACDVNENRLESVKHEIQRKGSLDLKRCSSAGMLQDQLLVLLASAALTPKECIEAILHKARERQASLKSLAPRVKTIARTATTILEQPSSCADWWFCFHGGGLSIGRRPPSGPSNIANVSQALILMKALSEMLDNEQRRFGQYLRGVGRVDPGVVQLLVNCWIYCSVRRNRAGERKPLRFQLDCLDGLARLLTDAFECTGKNTQFTAASLQQVFKRHVVPLLNLFFEERNQSAS